MDSYAMGLAFGKLMGGLIGAAIGALLGAFLVQLSTRIVAGFLPPYWQAWRASYFGYAGSMIVGFIIGATFFTSGVTLTGNLLLVPIGFLVQAMIYGSVLKDEDETTIGFFKACLVSVVQVVIVLVVVGVIVGVFWATLGPAIKTAADEFKAQQQQQQQQQVQVQDVQQQQQQQAAPSARGQAPATTGPNTPRAATGSLLPPPPSGSAPHPAVAARQEAVRLYPGLSVPNAPLNQRFLALYAEAKNTEPELLTREDWPLVLAERAVKSLGGVPEGRGRR